MTIQTVSLNATISDGSVTTAKLNDSAVTTAKINDSAVTSAKINDGTIVNADISASASLALSKLANGTWEKIYDSSVSGSAVTSISLTGLAGNTDDTYFLDFYMKNAVASQVNLKIRPNGATTAMSHQYLWINGGSTAAGRADNGDNGNIGQVNSSLYAHMQVIFKAKIYASSPRIYQATCALLNSATQIMGLDYRGHWNETSTEITSIDVVADTSGAIAVGSNVKLYKLSK